MDEMQRKSSKKVIAIWVIVLAASAAFIMSSIWREVPAPAPGATEPGIMASSKDFVSAAKQMGVTFALKGDQLEINTDQKLALAAIPGLQTLGVVNPKITAADIKRFPLTLSGGIGILIATGVVPYIYKTTQADKIHVSLYLDRPDQKGKMSHQLILSFDFTRSLYEKENWDKFPAKRFMEIAPNFKFDPWYDAELKKE